MKNIGSLGHYQKNLYGIQQGGNMKREYDFSKGKKNPYLKIRKGSVVYLRSGGPAMTVAKIKKGRARVVWTSEDGYLNNATLPLEVFKQ